MIFQNYNLSNSTLAGPFGPLAPNSILCKYIKYVLKCIFFLHGLYKLLFLYTYDGFFSNQLFVYIFRYITYVIDTVVEWPLSALQGQGSSKEPWCVITNT